MHQLIGKCPVCTNRLTATRLHCYECGTGIENNFSFNRLVELTGEQLAFVELFLKSEGKLNRVEKELNISYHTARGRLQEIIEALGYNTTADEKEITADERRKEILHRIATGEISAVDAIHLLTD